MARNQFFIPGKGFAATDQVWIMNALFSEVAMKLLIHLPGLHDRRREQKLQK